MEHIRVRKEFGLGSAGNVVEFHPCTDREGCLFLWDPSVPKLLPWW